MWEGDTPCRESGNTRVCPRGTKNACAILCMRFEVSETMEVKEIWERHWAITDILNRNADINVVSAYPSVSYVGDDAPIDA